MRRIAQILALAPLLGAACTGTPSTGTALQPIINGTTDSGDPAVVLVLSQTPGSNTGSLCTGEIISPHVVLTAAHCVDPAVSGVGSKFVVFTGTTLSQSSPATEFLAVAETHFDTMFNPSDPTLGHDVGVVILKSPTTIPPIPFNRKALPQSAIGQAARLVGYGITSGTDTMGTSAGTRRQAPSSVLSFDDLVINFEDMKHGICEGDSGGPAFLTLDGRELIVGITSYGIKNCPLTDPGTDTLVDKYTSFIDPYVLQFDPPAAGPGDSCSSDADCAPRSCSQTGVGKICVQSCDPMAMPATCPTGTMCTSVDGQNICAKPQSGHSGCDVGQGAPGGLAAMLGLLALALRRRRVRS